ncbi:hypothetical protein RB195_013164 [Necator americanus]
MEIIYSDEGGMITKQCGTAVKCIYTYNSILYKPGELYSECLYNESDGIFPGVVADVGAKIKPHSTLDIHSTHHESTHRWTLAYVPIQFLALITFFYLCFFFFITFKPYPNSNLVELSTLMEEEIARLSILTTEAVRSMTIEKSRKKSESVALKRHPELGTPGSSEDLCCPGTTCYSWQCSHCRKPVEIPSISARLPPLFHAPRYQIERRVPQTDSSRLRTKSRSETTGQKKTQMFNTNAKSTATKSMDPGQMARLKQAHMSSITPINDKYDQKPKGMSTEKKGVTRTEKKKLPTRKAKTKGPSRENSKKYAMIPIGNFRPQTKGHSKQYRPTTTK